MGDKRVSGSSPYIVRHRRVRGSRCRRRLRVLFSAGAGALLGASPCLAAWPSAPASNLPVCTAPVAQDAPQIASEGSGGTILVWQTTSPTATGGVFAQRVDRAGMGAWGADGIAVCTAESEQRQPKVAVDSAGGVVVVWQDFRSGEDWDVYAQRIDRFGRLRWGAPGVRISGAPGDQVEPQIAADGYGGALIAWRDSRVDGEWDLYAQAIDSAGQVRWSADGIAVRSGPGTPTQLQIVTVDPGGGVFVWRDSPDDGESSRVGAQRVDPEGSLMWGPNGVVVDDGAAPDAHPVAVGDGRGGCIVAWESGPVHAQRLDELGLRAWGDEGVALSTRDGMAPAIVSDDRGGATIAWQTEPFDEDAADIRMQSVRASGTLRWSADGVSVCQASGAQAEVAVVRAAPGGAIVMWRDARDDPFGDLYAQRVDSSGAMRWAADGIVVSDAPGFQGSLTVTADGYGGAIAAWCDGRVGRHIYAQRVSPGGRLGGVLGEADAPPSVRRRRHAGGAGPRPR